jgi:hypothetical protein
MFFMLFTVYIRALRRNEEPVRSGAETERGRPRPRVLRAETTKRETHQSHAGPAGVDARAPAFIPASFVSMQSPPAWRSALREQAGRALCVEPATRETHTDI